MNANKEDFAGSPNRRNGDPRSVAGRPLTKSKRLGQVFTPPEIANRMVTQLLAGRATEPVNILDPCVGPHTFPEQICKSLRFNPSDKLTLIDLDEEMISSSKKWAAAKKIKARFITDDYLCIPMGGMYDIAVLNPPYIRQEWVDRKESYRDLFKTRYGLKIPGTSNLYVYFIAKVVKDLKPGGSFACVVYDSWQSTRYGQWLHRFLRTECDRLEIESVRGQPFDGRLIDATIIFARKREAGSELEPQEVGESPWNLGCESGNLGTIEGFSPISEVYWTKRGLRLKQADFFLCDLAFCSEMGATPFVKKIAKVSGYVIPNDHPEAALLLESPNENDKIASELVRRLTASQRAPDENVSILTWYKERPDSWMLHRRALHAPILFNYYMRNRPRHIFNPSRAYSDNFYGLMAKEGFSPFAALATLNSTAICAEILARARNQGNGLAKIQLFEYRNVYVPNLARCSKNDVRRLDVLGKKLLARRQPAAETTAKIDQLLTDIFNDPRLNPKRVSEFYEEVSLTSRRPKES